MNDSLEADRTLLSLPSRQPPHAVVFLIWRALRQLSIVNVVVFFAIFSSGRVPLAVSGLLIVVLVGVAVYGGLLWWRFVYQVDGEDFTISKGVLSQERLVIPLGRVQSVSLEQNILHRMTGLTRVALETAGSSGVEFEIDAIEHDKAMALQRLTADYRRQAQAAASRLPRSTSGTVLPADPPWFDPATAPPPTGPPSSPAAAGTGLTGPTPPPGQGSDEVLEVLARRSFGDLIRVGVSQWPWAGLVLLAPLFAVLDDLRDALGIDVFDRVEESVSERLSFDVAVLVALALVMVVVVTVFGLALQVIQVLTADWDLVLARTGKGLRRESGLLSRTSRAASLDRIQSLESVQVPMERWFGIRRIRLRTVGEGDITVPGTSDEEMDRVRSLLFDPPGPTLDRRISSAVVFLAARNSFLVAAAACLLLVSSVLGWWSLLAFLAVPIRALEAHRRYRFHRWGLTDGRIVQTTRFVARNTEEMALVKAQSVVVEQSFFQRRRDLATVGIRTAEDTFLVPMIRLDEAEAVRDRVLYHVETSTRSWM